MNQNWYLGLDLGTTHLQAVLVNGDRQQQYPLYWERGDEKIFSLPMAVSSAHKTNQTWQISTESALATGKTLEGWLPFLRLAPCYFDEARTWFPTLPWSNQQAIALKSVGEALTFLLELLKDKALAVDLAPMRVRDVLGNLAGVIVGVPTHWDDTYRLNVRESLQQSTLVQTADQVVFVPEAIATLLGFQAQLPQTIGGTLVIHSGESYTDLAVVDLPEYFPQLENQHIQSHSFDYGGNALEQDILCQIIYPQWLPQLQDALSNLAKTMPRAGEIDPEYRLLAAWQWRNSPVGRSLIQAARQTKKLLQQRDQFSAHLGDQQWQVTRPELEKQVIYPFIQQLNQQINHLFAQSGTVIQGIQQIICSGSNTDYCWQWLEPALQQKFPQAELIRDTSTQSVNRVAAGLALVPLIPKIVDGDRHRYHDYFLLGELLRGLPKEPFSLDTLQRQLQTQGTNVRHCGQRLQELLYSQRPAGLAPDLDEQQSNVFLEYPMGDTPTTALCWLGDQGLYHLHEAQQDHFLEYWQYLHQSYKIKFAEPYNLPFRQTILQLSEPAH